jgi:hypothetical protein
MERHEARLVPLPSNRDESLVEIDILAVSASASPNRMPVVASNPNKVA